MTAHCKDELCEFRQKNKTLVEENEKLKEEILYLKAELKKLEDLLRSNSTANFSLIEKPSQGSSHNTTTRHVKNKENASIKFTTYKKRQGTDDKGKDFEIMMCALYCLKLISNDKVKDFEMTTNNQIYTDFDDISLKITSTDDTVARFLIQLKHIEAEDKKINENDIKANKKNNFSLVKYLRAFEKLEISDDTVCILFTNIATNILSDPNCASNFSIPVSESQNVSSDPKKTKGTLDISAKMGNLTEQFFEEIIVTKNIKSDNELLQFEIKDDANMFGNTLQFSQQFYLLTGQANLRNVQSTVRTLLFQLLNNNIYDEFEHFMKNWYSGRFVLCKNDVIYKLAELLLSPWCEILTSKKITKKSKLLKRAVMKFDMTIVREDDDIIRHIWKIKESDLFFKAAQKFFSISNDELSTNYQQRSKVLWYLDQAPLIIKVNQLNMKRIQAAVKIVSNENEKKKIVLIGEMRKDEFPNRKTFYDLTDLREENYIFNQIIKTFSISIQGRAKKTCEDLLNLEIEVDKCIQVHDLLKMSQLNYVVINKEKRKFPESYFPRTVSTLFFTFNEIVDFCVTLENCILLINSDLQHLEEVKENLQSFTIKNLSDGIKFDNVNHLSFLTDLNKKCTFHQFAAVCKTFSDFNVYLVQILDMSHCLLLLQNRKPVPLSNRQSIQETQIFDYFNNHLNVFCAPPGMGKSTLLTFLSKNCPPTFWNVYVKLISFNSFLKSQPNNEQILNCFMGLENAQKDNLSTKIRKAFVQTRKMYLFLDGLDEVDTANLKWLVNFIKWISSQGAYVWITCRESLREKITSHLKVTPIEINQVSQVQQKDYIQRRLKKQYENFEINQITEAVFKSSEVVSNNVYLLGIPLQLYIITEIFLNESLTLIDKNMFMLTKMYRIFFNGKKRFLHQKVGIEQEEQIGYRFDHHLKQYEIPALKAALNTEDFYKLELNEVESTKYIAHIKNVGDKFGIIDQVNEDEAIFNHQTYAEYFACVWFKNNLNHLQKLKVSFFSVEYENIRLMFDIMMAEEQPLHLAIIYQNIEKFEEHIDDFNKIDDANREALHLVCSYGMKYPKIKGLNEFDYPNYQLNRESQSYIEMVERLFERPINLNSRDGIFDFNCIDYSCITRCLYPLEKILSIDLAFSVLETPLREYIDLIDILFYASQMGYNRLLQEITNAAPELIKHKYFENILLLRIGVIGCKNDVYDVPREGNICCIQILINKEVNVNMVDLRRHRVLDYATQSGCYDMLRLLLNNGARCVAGNTFIHCMAKYGTLNQLSFELAEEYSVDLNARNSKGETALHLACIENQIHSVKQLLQKSVEVNIKDDCDMNALHYAAKSKHDTNEIVKYLKDNRIDVNAPTKTGVLPLHLLSKKGSLESLRHLENYIDTNSIDEEKMTLLHYAADTLNDNDAVIEFLVKKGVKVDAKSKSGKTALHLASTNFRSKNVTKILESSGSVNMIDLDGNTALHYAMNWKSNVKMIQSLIDYEIDVNVQNNVGKTALHLSCQENVPENLEILLRAKPNLELLSKEGKSALHYACTSWVENVESVKILKDNGANLEVRTKDGKTALQLAYEKNYTKIVKFLLDSETDINAVDNEDMNIAHYYANSQIGDINTLEKFVERRVNLNAKTKKGKTPLHFACENGQVEVVEKLIKCEVDTKSVDKLGNNALHYAAKSVFENLEIVDMLVEQKVDINAQNLKGMTPLLIAIEGNRLAMVKHLLKANSNPNIVDARKQNGLHFAVCIREFQPEMFETLVEFGASVNAQDEDGTTPLMVLCWKGKHKLVTKLSDVNVNIVDNNGRTALHYAGDFWTNNTEITTWLIQKGVDVNVKDIDGKTALHFASSNGQYKDVAVLLEKCDDKFVVDEKGMNALHYAVQNPMDGIETLEVLLANDLPIDSTNYKQETALHLVCQTANIDCFKFLLEREADITAVTAKNRNLLHYAAESQDINIFQKVVSLGLAVNSQDVNGVSPLHLTCQNSNYEGLIILSENDVDFMAVDIEKRNALHYAISAIRPKAEIIKYLVDREVEITAQDIYGVTAIGFAFENGCYRAIKILIEEQFIDISYFEKPEQFLYYSVYSGCRFGVEAYYEYNGNNFEGVNVNDKKFPLHFGLDGNMLNFNMLIKMTQFIDKLIEYIIALKEEKIPITKYTPEWLIQYLLHLESNQHQIYLVFDEVANLQAFNKRFQQIRDFLEEYVKPNQNKQ